MFLNFENDYIMTMQMTDKVISAAKITKQHQHLRELLRKFAHPNPKANHNRKPNCISKHNLNHHSNQNLSLDRHYFKLPGGELLQQCPHT